jgi:hypothetical protein
MNKRRSLEELDDVIDEILTQAPTEWFEEIDKIIKERKDDNKISKLQQSNTRV